MILLGSKRSRSANTFRGTQVVSTEYIGASNNPARGAPAKASGKLKPVVRNTMSAVVRYASFDTLRAASKRVAPPSRNTFEVPTIDRSWLSIPVLTEPGPPATMIVENPKFSMAVRVDAGNVDSGPATVNTGEIPRNDAAEDPAAPATSASG